MNNMSRKHQTFLDLCWKADDEAIVCKALEKEPELANCVDTRRYRRGETPLHHSSFKGNAQVVRLLLSYRAEVNARNGSALTPLHIACGGGHDEVARLLLEHGADVDAQNDRYLTPLHRACSYGYEAVVRTLLEYGAQVDVQDNSGWTPLHTACDNDDVTVTRLLLEHGANRNIMNDLGDTAHFIATWRGKRKVAPLLHSYFPITPGIAQLLLGLRGPTESPLTRLAEHALFEPQVLSLIKCLMTGEPSPAFEQLERDADGCYAQGLGGTQPARDVEVAAAE